MGIAPFRVGLVGANAERGWAKDAHVGALRTLPRFVIEGVSARSHETAQAAAKAFGAKRAFNDTYDLVRSPDIDVVSVTVKVPEHLPIVLAALEAGKHVFCEWPLGRDVAEAETMAAAAAKAKGRVIIGLQGTAAPAMRRAAEIVQSGALGKLTGAHVVSPTAGWARSAPAFYAYLNQRKNGATLSAISGGHTLAAVEMVLGRFTELQAQNTINTPEVKIVGSDEIITRDCPDHVAIIGRHASGCTSMVEIAGGRNPANIFVFQISGAKGDLKVRGSTTGGYQTGNLTLETTLDTAPAPAPVSPDLKGPPANVAEVYAQLAMTIDTGKQHGFDFSEAAHLTHLLATIDKASDTGMRQRL